MAGKRRQIIVRNEHSEIVTTYWARGGLSDAEALMFAAVKHIEENRLGAVSMNWYIRDTRFRVYTHLIRSTGPKGMFEYNPTGGYLEFSI